MDHRARRFSRNPLFFLVFRDLDLYSRSSRQIVLRFRSTPFIVPGSGESNQAIRDLAVRVG